MRDPSWPPALWYAAADAIQTYLLYQKIRGPALDPVPEVDIPSQEPIYMIEKLCVPATRWMERCRIPVNRAKVEELIRVGQREWLPCLREVFEAASAALGRDVAPGYFRLLIGDDPALRLDPENTDASLMERVDIMAPLSADELRNLVEAAHVKSYATHEYPVRQGEPGDSFYIIKKGTVDVIVGTPPETGMVVASLSTGNFFGEMSLLTGAVRTASIRVKDDAEFIVIDRENFRSVLVKNPSIAESMSRILAERQASLDAQREKLDSASVERRKRDASGKMLHNIRHFFGLG